VAVSKERIMVPCLTRLLALVTTGLVVQCAAARAQSPEPSPDTMAPSAVFDAVPAGIDRLVQGDELRIVRRDARETFGILQRVSSSALTIATETGSQDVLLDLVRRVRRRGDRVWDGLVIGAAFGAAISAATFVPCDGYASWEPCSAANFTTSRAGDALAGAAVFGLIGLGIDAAHRGWSTVYSRPSGLPPAPGRNMAARDKTESALPEGVIVRQPE
jgi:hypothetical protein